MGKTQFCHMLAVLAAMDLEAGCGVVYLDTERAFSAARYSSRTLHPFSFQ